MGSKRKRNKDKLLYVAVCRTCGVLHDGGSAAHVLLLDKDTKYGTVVAAFDYDDIGKVVKVRFMVPGLMPESDYAGIVEGAHEMVHYAISRAMNGWRSCACAGAVPMPYENIVR